MAYTVFIARASEPVISKHLWALNTAGQTSLVKTLGTARNCQIAIEEVQVWSAITYFNNGYSELNTPGRPRNENSNEHG
jgi:hypothetical protein